MAQEPTPDDKKSKEQQDIAVASQAVDQVKTQLESLIARLGSNASPALTAALQNVSRQSVNTAEDAGAAKKAAEDAQKEVRAQEGAELQNVLGEAALKLSAGMAGFGMLAGLANSSELRESFRQFGAAIGTDNQLIQNLSKSSLFVDTKSGVTQNETSRDKSQVLGM